MKYFVGLIIFTSAVFFTQADNDFHPVIFGKFKFILDQK